MCYMKGLLNKMKVIDCVLMSLFGEGECDLGGGK